MIAERTESVVMAMTVTEAEALIQALGHVTAYDGADELMLDWLQDILIKAVEG